MNIGTALPYDATINELTRPPAAVDPKTVEAKKRTDDLTARIKAEQALLVRKDTAPTEIEAVPPADYPNMSTAEHLAAQAVKPLDEVLNTKFTRSIYSTPEEILGHTMDAAPLQLPAGPVPFSNGLTPAQAELLAMLAEEAGEVVQVVGKILRHGWGSRWKATPNSPQEGSTNGELLRKELVDLDAVRALLGRQGAIEPGTMLEIEARIEDKNRWRHHT